MRMGLEIFPETKVPIFLIISLAILNLRYLGNDMAVSEKILHQATFPLYLSLCLLLTAYFLLFSTASNTLSKFAGK